MSEHGISKLLVRGSGLAARLPAGFTVFCAWMALTISVTVMPSFANWSGFTHSLMAYWPAPKTCRLPTPGARSDGIVEVDVGIVGQERGIVGSMRRVKRKEHERSGRRLADGDPVVVDVRRKLSGGLVLARLGENEIGIRIRFQIEVYNQRGLELAVAFREYM